jgi:thioredoxin 1
MTKNIVEVSDSTFETEVLKSDKPVLVDFWAEWCGPCRMIAPIVEEIAQEYQDKIKVCKLDVDYNPATAQQFGVMSIPTLIVFKQGKPAARIIGYQPKSKLLDKILPIL